MRPFFFAEKRENATVNAERYIQLLKNKFTPALRRIGINIENMWFQQDWATFHTAKHVLSWLHETFGEISSHSKLRKFGLPTLQTSIRLTFSFGDTIPNCIYTISAEDHDRYYESPCSNNDNSKYAIVSNMVKKFIFNVI